MTLDEQYQKTIDDQRAYLLKLQDDFNKACEEIKKRAQEKLKGIPDEDKEKKEEVLKDQKTELEGQLHTLKVEVERSTKNTMRKLEAIIREKEKQILADLEKQIQAI